MTAVKQAPDAAGLSSDQLRDVYYKMLLARSLSARQRILQRMGKGSMTFSGEGHEAAQFAIVASGPNSASPHHDAGDRVIGPGEPIVLDIGGSLDGYCSDTTRTLWVTGGDASKGPTPEFRRLFDLLRDAQAQASAAVRPGVSCERIDAVARDIITAGGHGPDFFHRVGHGIGLETHEEPYLVAGNGEPLRQGMTFSVEPGIYLADRYGARIEDIVVCGPDGPDILNQSSRDLWVVPG